MITAQNILRHELTGLDAAVSDSANPQIAGMSGRVAYETQSTLVLETKRGKKTVPKDVCTLTFAVGGRDVRVRGDRILRRPADRLVTRQ